MISNYVNKWKDERITVMFVCPYAISIQMIYSDVVQDCSFFILEKKIIFIDIPIIGKFSWVLPTRPRSVLMIALMSRYSLDHDILHDLLPLSRTISCSWSISTYLPFSLVLCSLNQITPINHKVTCLHGHMSTTPHVTKATHSPRSCAHNNMKYGWFDLHWRVRGMQL